MGNAKAIAAIFLSVLPKIFVKPAYSLVKPSYSQLERSHFQLENDSFS
ncbi:MAG: hypothetical protein LBC20_12480 [Planctomycetaceae bacterium]|jgi:hypothetical protein|nr:hypothetical protein [Planctomycetaceae bacterium]